MRNLFAAALGLAALTAQPLPAQDAPPASATLMGVDGAALGTARITEGPHGVLIHADLEGLPPGPHAIHIHETGVCEAPFESAGAHYDDGGAEHGYLVAEGPHTGDLPNLHVPESGAVAVEMTSTATLAMLRDQDGAALIVHAGPDDYHSQPSGASGDRIACGVIGEP